MLFSSVSYSQCLVVDNLNGWSAKARDKYTFYQDGFSQDRFYLKFVEDAWMSNKPDLIKIPCVDIGVLVCHDARTEQVLSWSLGNDQETVMHTRVIKDSFFEGVVAMIGNAVGECDY
jgi:predicted amidohydrolase